MLQYIDFMYYKKKKKNFDFILKTTIWVRVYFLIVCTSFYGKGLIISKEIKVMFNPIFYFIFKAFMFNCKFEATFKS